MARLLALDTSTEACSVALLDGESVDERFIIAPREHMQRLLPMVDELLAAHGLTLHQLDAIAFGRGPGSFTGLRICLGVAQGLAFGAELPLVPISSLAVLAQGARSASGEPILAAIDARMDEVYWSWFQRGSDGLVMPLGPEAVTAPELVAPLANLTETAAPVGVGSGFTYAVRLGVQGFARTDAAALPRAADLARLALPHWQQGLVVPAEEALPVYLRDEVAWKQG